MASAKRLGELYGYSVEHSSFIKWTALELLDLLRQREDDPVLVIFEEFKDKMNVYISRHPDQARGFSIAYFTADEIIDWVVED